jgi:hypothetical protein
VSPVAIPMPCVCIVACTPCGLSLMDSDVSAMVGTPRCVGRRTCELISWRELGESRCLVAGGGCSACVVVATGERSRLDGATLDVGEFSLKTVTSRFGRRASVCWSLDVRVHLGSGDRRKSSPCRER